MSNNSVETVSIRARKRSIEVDAWQYTGDYHLDNAPAWVRDYRSERRPFRVRAELGLFGDWFLQVPTLEGVMGAAKGDWIIRGVKGELYPCKPEIFEETYERL